MTNIDQQDTRILAVLDGPEGVEVTTWSPVRPRWQHQAVLATFAAGCNWNEVGEPDLRVKRALIVDQAE